MKRFGEIIYTPEKEGKEKHVPVIDAPSHVKASEEFKVSVTVGKDVAHPNTVEHHIKWIMVFGEVEGRNPVHIATYDMGPTFAYPHVTFTMKIEKPTVLRVIEYCNIHGLWENSHQISLM